MTPEQRRRAARAVTARLAELDYSIPQFAHRAGVDATTVRAFMNGARWPNQRSRRRMVSALGWPDGEITRRAYAPVASLADFTLAQLLHEACRRIEQQEQNGR